MPITFSSPPEDTAMRTCVVSLTVALSMTPAVWAQSPTPARTISVSGSAEVRVTPSLANLVVGVETRNRSLAAAKAENDRRVQAIVRSMQALGVETKDIQTDYVQVNPDYTTRDDTLVLLRYFPVRMAVGFVVIALGVGLFVAGFESRAVQHSGAVRALVGMLGG